MAYVKPTPADLKAMFPEFATVSDDIVQIYLDLANRFVDETWLEGDFANAIMFLAAHFLAIMGYGKSADTYSNLSIFQTIRSGSLTLTRFDKSQQTDDFMNFNATRYGKMYRMLLKMNKGGPRIVGGCFAPVSGYAKDWPL